MRSRAGRSYFVVVATGGFITGERARQPDFLTPYLEAVLATLGIGTVQFLYLERIPRGSDPLRNTKLGPGGLSDVEWVVQLLQLANAHEVPGLRTASTLTALAAAEQADLVTPDEADALRDAWLLAGRLRNAILLLRGRASDTIPSDPREAGDLDVVAAAGGAAHGGRGDGRRVRGGRRGGVELRGRVERAGRRGLHVDIACRNRAYRVDEFTIGDGLEQVSAGARFEQRHQMFVFGVHGEHEHAPRHFAIGVGRADGIELLQLARGGQSVHIRHGQVHDQHVRIEPLGQGQRITTRAAFADYRDVLGSGQYGLEAGANDLVIIHQHDANEVRTHASNLAVPDPRGNHFAHPPRKHQASVVTECRVATLEDTKQIHETGQQNERADGQHAEHQRQCHAWGRERRDGAIRWQ